MIRILILFALIFLNYYPPFSLPMSRKSNPFRKTKLIIFGRKLSYSTGHIAYTRCGPWVALSVQVQTKPCPNHPRQMRVLVNMSNSSSKFHFQPFLFVSGDTLPVFCCFFFHTCRACKSVWKMKLGTFDKPFNPKQKVWQDKVLFMAKANGLVIHLVID